LIAGKAAGVHAVQGKILNEGAAARDEAKKEEADWRAAAGQLC